MPVEDAAAGKGIDEHQVRCAVAAEPRQEVHRHVDRLYWQPDRAAQRHVQHRQDDGQPAPSCQDRVQDAVARREVVFPAALRTSPQGPASVSHAWLKTTTASNMAQQGLP